jgi:hypothetical protein
MYTTTSAPAAAASAGANSDVSGQSTVAQPGAVVTEVARR